MLLDAQARYSDAQDISGAGPHVSDNVYDAGEERRLGTGEELYLVAHVDTAFTDVGSDSTVEILVQSDDNEGFSSPSQVFSLGIFGALSAAGSRLIAKLPPERLFERYHRLSYSVSNGDLSTGAVSAYLVKDIHAFTAYPNGYSIQ